MQLKIYSQLYYIQLALTKLRALTKSKVQWIHPRYSFSYILARTVQIFMVKDIPISCLYISALLQQTLGNRLEAQTPGSEQWVESAPPTRSHTPSSVHSHTTGSAVTQGVDHFMTNNGGTSSSVIATNNDKVSPNGINFPNSNFLLNVAREREAQQNSRYCYHCIKGCTPV